MFKKITHNLRNCILIAAGIYLMFLSYDYGGFIGFELLCLIALILLAVIGISTIIIKLNTIINKLSQH